MKNLIILSLLAFLCACQHSQSPIVGIEYAAFLNPIHFESSASKLDESINFWEGKLANSPDNSTYIQKMASLLSARFAIHKNIDDLKESQHLLEELHARYPESVSILHQLVQNSITQHQFRAAFTYASKALSIGEKKDVSQLLMVDILLEQGEFDRAEQLLTRLGNEGRFDRQIRYVKLYDAKGDLDRAIKTMELALENAYATSDKQLICWSLSNLGDMYGHQGQIEQSYAAYLEALKIDANHLHSLKGIAWIAYSNDRDYHKAELLLEYIYALNRDPEIASLLTDIYEIQGQEDLAINLKKRFITRVSDERYGNMYGSYLIDALNNPKQALHVAKLDLEERRHPMSYAHYALALHRVGRCAEATEILEDKVLERTGEPESYRIAAQIYAESGKSMLAKKYMRQVRASAYELGPHAVQATDSLLDVNSYMVLSEVL